jgi:hypothetical protein
MPCRSKLMCLQGTLKVGSITVLLTCCLTGLESACMTADNFCFYLQNRLIQTVQTGGQLYSDTFLFSVPWSNALGDGGGGGQV